jgi:hypothetical protein
MTLDELHSRLDALGVSRASYSLDDPNASERYCVSRAGRRWSVYYNERGFRNAEQTFGTEDAAYDRLYELVAGDSTTRRWRPDPGSDYR